jgi:EpsI family protein
VALGLLTATAAAAVVLPERTEIRPARADLVEFPLQLGDWRGRPRAIGRDVLEVLNVDDYLKADYLAGASGPVNLYIAYFASQHRGAYMHSPETCLPGGGWKILSIEQRQIPGVAVNGQPLVVNRAEIGKGEERQLVYYWFQQRGRLMTDEYVMRWYLFQDAVTRRRTDGALIRLIAPISRAESLSDADERLVEFAKLVVPHLERFVPN